MIVAISSEMIHGLSYPPYFHLIRPLNLSETRQNTLHFAEHGEKIWIEFGPVYIATSHPCRADTYLLFWLSPRSGDGYLCVIRVYPHLKLLHLSPTLFNSGYPEPDFPIHGTTGARPPRSWITRLRSATCQANGRPERSSRRL